MLEVVQKIISEECGVAKDDVVPSANLRNDLMLDSMAAANVSFEIETAFDVTITDEELANLQTVDDILALLKEKDAVAL